MTDNNILKNKNIHSNAFMSELFVSKKYVELNEAALSNLKKKPNDLDNLNALALSYKLLGRTSKAEETFSLLLTLDCKKDFIFSNAGNFFYDLGKIGRSIDCHQEALKLNPKNINSLNQTGLCLSNQGKDREAIEYYKKSLDINNKDMETNVNILNSVILPITQPYLGRG